MAEEQRTFFGRMVTRIRTTLQPDRMLERNAEEVARRMQGAEDRKMIADARDQALDGLRELSRFTQEELRPEFAAHSLPGSMTPALSVQDWQDEGRLTSQIEADLHLQDPAAQTPGDRIAAYAALARSYESIAAEIGLTRMETGYAAAARPDPEIARTGEWVQEDAGVESRLLVVRTAEGYHPGYERSHWGDDGPVSHSTHSLASADLALSLAGAYREDGEHGLEEAMAEHKAAAARIAELASNGRLSLGEHTELSQALSSVDATPAALAAGDLAGLSLSSTDTEAQALVLKALAGRPEGFQPQRLISEARAAGVETPDAAGLDAHVSTVYGSDEAYLRHDRLTLALDHMARAVGNGQRPMFQSREHMASFRRDLDQTYGAGSMDRLRSGDTSDLAGTYPSETRRLHIAHALHDMADEAERTAPRELEEKFAASLLAARLQHADWYHSCSDDRQVRARGRDEAASLLRDVTEFATRSKEAAEQISRIWDQQTPPDYLQKFPGYMPEKARDAPSPHAPAGRELSLDQSRER